MPNKPKAFVSYSWTSPAHRDRIRGYAERLLADGAEVILDQWDLKEGQDKNAFMEQMVTDPSVTHVLVFSDAAYAAKANNRRSGVGTESQIISQEVYKRVDQQKFIPIACEVDDNQQPILPVYLASRIAIDFSTPEAANDNWEQLIRVLYGKPLHEKPVVGTPPAYIVTDARTPANPIAGKFMTLRQALLQGRPGVKLYRDDFIRAAVDFADKLRVRTPPDVESLPTKIEADLRTLLPVRDHLIDWLLLEGQLASDADFTPVVVETLERILSLRYRPDELTSWSDGWFDAHRIFVYEVFIYVVAALIETKHYAVLHELFTTNYLLPESQGNPGTEFDSFDAFYGYSDVLERRNQRDNLRRLSPVADLMKDRASRADIPFPQVMQAELVIFLAALIRADARWYPQTLVYLGFGKRFPIFIRGVQHKHFDVLASITGIQTGDALRQAVEAGMQRMGVNQWFNFVVHSHVSLWDAMNMDRLDTIA